MPTAGLRWICELVGVETHADAKAGVYIWWFGLPYYGVGLMQWMRSPGCVRGGGV